MKNTYESIIEIMRSTRNVEDSLETAGLRYDYGYGTFGSHFETVLNKCFVLLKNALGLHVVEKPATCHISGIDYPITIDILYLSDEDPDFSITEDDFCEFVNIVSYDDEIGNMLKNAMWKAIVEKDNEAKKKVNTIMKNGTLGGIVEKE